MRVDPSQLIPGCILSENVYGKTSHSLIDRNTVLTNEHIEFLQKFLIKSVTIFPKMENGNNFKSAIKLEENQQKQKIVPNQMNEPSQLFVDHYKDVVKAYNRFFSHWRNNTPLDMPALRKLLIPFIERVEEEGLPIYDLYNYSKKEDYFYHHDISVSIMAAFLAKKMGFEKGEWIQVGLAGFLSNCGMSKVNQQITTKTGSLKFKEREEMETHSVYSYRLIESIPTITNAVKIAVLQHHERLDGSGYPLSLGRKRIHIYAKIIAVCDTYHAMTSDRLYQEKQSPPEVINELKKARFTTLDPKVVDVFVNYSNV